MAIQFQNDLSHWEIVNRSDSDLDFDDDASVFGVESLDSFSLTYSSSSDGDEKDPDRHDELDILDDDDAMRDESLPCDDVIGPSNHVAFDDGVMTEESLSCDDVINPNNHVVVDEEDELREKSRLCNDVIDLAYHVSNLSGGNNNVEDRDQKDLSIVVKHCRSRDDVIDPSPHYVYSPQYQNYDYDHDDDDEDDDDYDYEVDDELVPWWVKDRFERQRMRKLGKRSSVRMMKAKQSTLLYTKPGCVRGKHGLGLKVY